MRFALATLALATSMSTASFAQAPATTTAAPGTAAMGTSTTDGAMQGGAMNATPATGENAMGSSATSGMQAADAGVFVTAPDADAFRVSEITGKNVYDNQGQSLGEVNDILIGADGSAKGVIVGVGGFLGIGEKNVAVNMSALRFEQQADDTSTAATTPATGTATATGTAATTGTQTAAMTQGTEVKGASAEDADRIVLDVSREQLQQAPAYETAER